MTCLLGARRPRPCSDSWGAVKKRAARGKRATPMARWLRWMPGSEGLGGLRCMAERMWHPISKLDFLVDHTASWLRDVRENAVTLRRTIYLFRPRVPGPAGPPAANGTRGQRPPGRDRPLRQRRRRGVGRDLVLTWSTRCGYAPPSSGRGRLYDRCCGTGSCGAWGVITRRVSPPGRLAAPPNRLA